MGVCFKNFCAAIKVFFGGKSYRCCRCCNDTEACTSWKGGANYDLVILGESPGSDELGHPDKRPFVGPTGANVRGALAFHGINIDDCFLINCINCDLNGWNQGAKAFNAFRCKKRVYREIFSRKRVIILALGKVALETFDSANPPTLKSVRGTRRSFVCPITSERIPIIYTRHPSPDFGFGSITNFHRGTNNKQKEFLQDVAMVAFQYNWSKANWHQVRHGLWNRSKWNILRRLIKHRIC